MIITLAGDPGSGKSTVAKKLAEIFSLKQYSIGGKRRAMAEEMGMKLSELNKLGEKKSFTDKKVDEWQKNLGEKEDNFIIDGRLAFYFIPHSVKIYLAVDENVGVERIWKDLQEGRRVSEAKNLKSVSDIRESLRERKMSDVRRYKKYYDLNPYDRKNFDFILDTTHLSIDEVVDALGKYIKNEGACPISDSPDKHRDDTPKRSYH